MLEDVISVLQILIQRLIWLQALEAKVVTFPSLFIHGIFNSLHIVRDWKRFFHLQLDHKSEDLSNLRIELEEKRAECLRLKTQLQEMDDKFFDSQAKTKEELGRALRVRTHHVVYVKYRWIHYFKPLGRSKQDCGTNPGLVSILNSVLYRPLIAFKRPIKISF